MNPPTNSVRCYARTMQQAFGMHTDARLHPMPDLTRERRRAARLLRLWRKVRGPLSRMVRLIAGH